METMTDNDRNNKDTHNNSHRPLAVVTGASSGIGYELAIQFAQHGYDLAIVAEDDGIAQACEKLKKLNVEISYFQYDLASFEGVENFYQDLQALNRPVNAVAINAGVGAGGAFCDNDLKTEMNLLNLNVLSAVHLAKRMVQDMVQNNQEGKILFTSSIAATTPAPYEAVYAASKAFIQSFAEALHYELEDKNITVTAFQPGPTETNFFHRAGMDDTEVGRSKKDDPKDVARQGFEALMDGKSAKIVGSLGTRLKNSMNDLIPEQVKAYMHADKAEPRTARK